MDVMSNNCYKVSHLKKRSKFIDGHRKNRLDIIIGSKCLVALYGCVGLIGWQGSADCQTAILILSDFIAELCPPAA